MFCQSCGKEVPATVRFCEACGKPVAGALAVPAGEIRYAGFWLRFVAYLIDSLVVGVFNFFVGFFFGIIMAASAGGRPMRGDGPQMVLMGVTYLVGFLAWLLYFAFMESSSWQATLGKKALSLMVTDSDGNRLSFGRALGRTGAKILSFLTLYIGFILAGFTQKKQALHDMIAGCLVVKKA